MAEYDFMGKGENIFKFTNQFSMKWSWTTTGGWHRDCVKWNISMVICDL